MAPPQGGQEVAAAAEAGGAPPRQQQGFGQSISGIIRIAVLWYFVSKFFTPATKPTEPAFQISNLFNKGETLVKFTLFIFISFSFCLSVFFLCRC